MTPDECRRIFSMLSQYLDGELPGDLCEQISAHIQDCPPCVAFLESLKKSTDLCRKVEAGARPEPLPEPVRAELKSAFESFLEARGLSPRGSG